MSSLERLGEAGWLPDVRSEESIPGHARRRLQARLFQLRVGASSARAPAAHAPPLRRYKQSWARRETSLMLML